jgi:hypothetical protein
MSDSGDISIAVKKVHAYELFIDDKGNPYG